jgi:hypothetical protein
MLALASEQNVRPRAVIKSKGNELVGRESSSGSQHQEREKAQHFAKGHRITKDDFEIASSIIGA